MQSEITLDSLAQEIRRVDGNHSLGAGALAEALMPFLSALSDKQAGEVNGSEWHRAVRPGGGSVMLYTLREEGRRRGEPVMTNDVMINIDRGTGSSTDLEPIVQRIRSALVDVPAVEPVGYASEYGLKTLAGKAHHYCLSVNKRPENEFAIPLYAYPHTVVKPLEWLEEPVAYLRLDNRTDIDGETYTGLQMSDVSDERAFPVYTHRPIREGEDSAEVERLRGLLDVAIDTLDTYADPTGYTDNNGEHLPPDEVVHQGLLAKETAANLRAALAATRSGSATASKGVSHAQ